MVRIDYSKYDYNIRSTTKANYFSDDKELLAFYVSDLRLWVKKQGSLNQLLIDCAYCQCSKSKFIDQDVGVYGVIKVKHSCRITINNIEVPAVLFILIEIYGGTTRPSLFISDNKFHLLK